MIYCYRATCIQELFIFEKKIATGIISISWKIRMIYKNLKNLRNLPQFCSSMHSRKISRVDETDRPIVNMKEMKNIDNQKPHTNYKHFVKCYNFIS